MDYFISENQIAESMTTVIIPYLENRKEEGFVNLSNGISLHYHFYSADAPRGTLLILHGFTESIPKYRELIYYFLKDNLNVFMYEHRGHGWSTREVENPGLTHVRYFENYILDLKELIEKKISSLPGPYYLFSHSMGGGICAMYLEEGSAFFDKAVLSSPMIMPNCMNIPLWVCKFLFGSQVLIGRGKKKVFTYPKERGNREWNKNTDDTSPERFMLNEFNKRKFKECSNFAPTYSWINQAIRVCKKLLAKGKPENIAIPVLLFSAACDDTVMNPDQERFIARVPKGKIIKVPHATHTIFYNRDDIYKPYLEQVLDFLK